MTAPTLANGEAELFPNFPGFYGFHIRYNNGKAPESMWFITEEAARRYARRVGRRKSVLEVRLIFKRGDGSLGKLPKRMRKRRPRIFIPPED